MAADLDLLVPDFGKACRELIKNCQARGIEMRPNEALRSPWTQAKYWRQSRSIQEIGAMIAKLKAAGAPFIAQIIDNIGPQHGDPVTNALPGSSWHQWGEALDCFWVVDGKAEWSTTKKVNGLNGYRTYAEEAAKLGLTAGGLWTSIKDWPHVQKRAAANPLSGGGLTWPKIDAEMRARFPNP